MSWILDWLPENLIVGAFLYLFLAFAILTVLTVWLWKRSKQK